MCENVKLELAEVVGCILLCLTLSLSAFIYYIGVPGCMPPLVSATSKAEKRKFSSEQEVPTGCPPSLPSSKEHEHVAGLLCV